MSGIHHICYEVEEQYDFREIFKKMSIGKIFTDDMIAPALGYRQVVFACLKNGMFVEFLLGGGKDEGTVCTNS